MKGTLKRVFCGLLSIIMLLSAIPQIAAKAEEAEKFSYTMFAASDKEGAISIQADNTCINGNIAANGTITHTGNLNVNGTKTENAQQDMIYISSKLNEQYFQNNSTKYMEDYTVEEMNINLNNPVVANGTVTLVGNAGINTQIKSESDILIQGQNLNANNSVLYSAAGNIYIQSNNMSITGLIYAPYGNVEIKAQNANLNNVIVIAQNIMINCSSANINYNESMGRFVGVISENPVDVNDEMDTDEDGIVDLGEKNLGTNIYSADTDEDGLTDYQEIYLTDTNPIVYDSVAAGVSDAEADSDADGFSNIREIVIGTLPYKADTDGDGLSDLEETDIHGTDPLKQDTDEDGLADSDEIVLALNPLKQDTDGNGIFDGEEYIEQNVGNDRFQEELFADNEVQPSSLTVSAQGDVNANLDVCEYNGDLIGDERSYVGKPIQIEGSKINAGRLSFRVTDKYTLNSYVVGGKSTNGLIICYNDGEQTIPLETIYDETTKTLSADISAEGIYFVLDVVDWAKSLGVEIPEKNSIYSTRALMNASADVNIADVGIRGQVDIVFVIDTTGSMYSDISNVKNNLTAFVDEIEGAGITPSFALVEYRDITYDGSDSTNVKQNDDTEWFKDGEDFKRQIEKLGVSGGGDTPETAIDALEMARQLSLRTSAQKFFVLVTDAGYKVANRYGIGSMDEMIQLLVEDKINVSVVSNSYCKSTYSSLYNKTGGVFANVEGNFKNELLTIADKINTETNSGYWIALNGLIPKIVKLDTQPSAISIADTDADALLDNEELMSIEPMGYVDTKQYFNALVPSATDKSNFIPVYGYYSSPVDMDTDGDGIDDEEEYFIGTDRRNKDSDWDGLDDGTEYVTWYDPLEANPDGDTYNDKEEYDNGTNPFSYDLTADEWIEDIKNGAIKGDVIKNPNIPELIGQIGGSSVPLLGTLGDLRDTIANASRGDWLMSGLSIFGVAPVVGDASKMASKVAEFFGKNADKADELAKLSTELLKAFPDEILDIIPGSAMDDIIESIANGNLKMTHDSYRELVELATKLGRKIPTASDVYPTAAKVVAKDDVWKKKPWARGFDIDELLGNNLGRTYKTYDRFDMDSRVATSVKSLDPFCKSYQSASKLKSRLNRYGKELINGKSTVTYKTTDYKILKKQLNIALPDIPLSDAQQDVIREFILENKENCDIIITIVQ